MSMLVRQELLVPAPAVVASTFVGLAATPGFWAITGWSLLRILVGFLAGVVAGCGAAVLTTRFRLADVVLSPALRVVRAAPVASFVILALVWIPTGRLPAFIAFTMVVPVVWDTVAEGCGDRTAPCWSWLPSSVSAGGRPRAGCGSLRCCRTSAPPARPAWVWPGSRASQPR